MKKISTGWKEHTLVGLVVFIGLYFGLRSLGQLPTDPIQLGVMFGLTILAALFPDVDTNSLGQDIVYGALIIADGYLIYKGFYREAAILGFLAMTPVVAEHRGWTHSWLAAFLVPLPLLYPTVFHIPTLFSGQTMYTATLVGYTSHIIIDRYQNTLLNGALRILFFWL